MTPMRRLLIFYLFFQVLLSHAQTTEDFNDGDFADGNPLTWTTSQLSGGNDFVISSGELQSNGPAATASLFMSSNLGIDFTTNDVIWTFKVRYDGGAPSSSNFVEVYLMSDVADVSGSPQGYYIKLGESGSTDGIDLLSTASGNAIISDAADQIATTLNAHIRVTRTGAGEWTLEADASGGDAFTTIGSASNTDSSSGDFFGFFVKHSSTKNQDFFFDDVTITVTPIPDTTPPTIQSVTSISNTGVDVLFSETVDQTTAETSANYTLDGGVTVSNAARDASNSALIHLTTSSLTNGNTYTVTVNNVEDESANAIVAESQDTFQYLVIEEAEAEDIVVNEFHASASDASGIPNAEFIELFNVSDKFIQLENWTFSDATGTSNAFSVFLLEPNQYVILTAIGNGALFNAYGDVLEVGSFRALNNGGDDIILTNSLATIIYSITYTSSTSGVSTEMINPNGPDYSLNNYALSSNPDGGTPGAINSVFDDTPDTTPPAIMGIEVVSSTELDVSFTEPLQASTGNVVGNYTIDGGILVSNANRDNVNNQLVHLTVSDLVSGDTRTLTVNNITDLSGNAIVSNSTIDFEYLQTEEAIPGDIVINEFYAAPSSESTIPNVEFVEIFNRSEKFINLENWIFTDQSSSSTPFGPFIIRPNSFVILTETDNGILFDSFGDWVEVGNFPALNNGGDSIIISNSSSLIIHEIKYTSSISGVSTELINPNGPDYSSSNYGLSINVDGGSPGAINSIFDDTPDTTAPIIASIEVISSTELSITFSEPLQEIPAETTANYAIDGEILVSSAERDATNNLLVHLVVSSLISGDERTLTINNVTDLSGNSIEANTTIDFKYILTVEAEVGDVVINEFYANPNGESEIPNAEFIEILNISDKFIQMEGWTFSDNTSASSAFPLYILEPGSYLILSSSGNISEFSSFENVIPISGFRGLNNGGDEIAITNANTINIHSITYLSSISGISTELINPNGPDYSENNYGLSIDEKGGTPGTVNSLFDDTPDNTPPTFERINVLSSTELELVFNEPLEETSAETIGNYSIDGGITISSVKRDSAVNSKVRLIVSSLTSAEVRILTINNVTDLSGNVAAENTIIAFEYLETEEALTGDILINEFLADPIDNNDDFIELWNVSEKFIDLTGWRIRDNAATSVGFSPFIIRPNEYLIIYDEDATIDYPSFGKAISIPSLTLNNTNDQIELIRVDSASMAFISYTDQPKEGISSELINPNDPCLSELSYKPSISSTGSTPGVQNSIFDDTPDSSAPMITSYNFDVGLRINFSETMDISSLHNGTFLIDGLTIDIISTDEENPIFVEISFNEALELGRLYELSISNVSDCWGNLIQPYALSFGQGRLPVFNEILITEIMADPDPSIALPDREYIEIHNSTLDIIRLDGVAFSDESSSALLPDITINPGAYLTLTTNTGAAEFIDGAIGVSSFPSLSNSGEQLVLALNGDVLFSVSYDKSWHTSVENEVGGVSLEMIDLTNPCAEDNNWTSSADFKGGTPGKGNSASGNVPDNFPPEIVKVFAINSDSIRIDFNEKIDPTLINLVSTMIEPEVSILSLNTNYLKPKSLFLVLNGRLEESVLYKLTLSNVLDCNGNASEDQDFDFALPSTPDVNQVLLSEILFNPYTNGVDFVELYNNSDTYLNLQNWQLANLSDGEVDNQKEISSAQLVFEPRSFLAISSNSDVLLTNYPKGNRNRFFQMESLPTYANNEGTVVLLDQDSIEVERFNYTDDFHYGLLNSFDGVSLERISYSAINNANNWRSASSTVGFATPGYQNSQSFEAQAPKGTIQIEPKVFLPGDSGSGRDFTLISYQVETAGQFANINVYDQTGRLVKTLAEGILLANSGFIRWDGTTNNGALARLGYHVVLFELYDSNGNSETIKETVVVGRDF